MLEPAGIREYDCKEPFHCRTTNTLLMTELVKSSLSLELDNNFSPDDQLPSSRWNIEVYLVNGMPYILGPDPVFEKCERFLSEISNVIKNATRIHIVFYFYTEGPVKEKD